MFFANGNMNILAQKLQKDAMIQAGEMWFVIVVVCGGCQEVVDMYFHTQLGARREPPADTNASCQALLSAGLDFQKIIICVIKIIINNIFVINMIIIFSSKASTEQALFKLKSVEF